MKDKLLMIVFVLVLGTILTTALVAVNRFTEPLIQRNQEIRIKASVLEALEIGYTDESMDVLFDQRIEVREKDGKTVYVSNEGARAFEFSGFGLWGPITGVFAVNGDLKTILGVTIIHQEETPGLGSRIAESWYLDSFKGKTFQPRLQMVQPGKGRQGKNTIDAISGATMTSVAFIDILNKQVGEYLSVLEIE
jgi:Na+-transporting NADH:ubiquinone oxidoreductase subunit C